MALVARDDRYNEHVAASTSTGPFLVGFRLFDPDFIEVYVDNLPQPTGLTFGVDWTLDATYDDGFDDNATITLTTAVTAGQKVQIYGKMVADRQENWQGDEANFIAKLNIENARLAAMVSELQRDRARTPRMEHIVTNPTGPVTVDLNHIAYDDEETVVMGMTPDYRVVPVPIFPDTLDLRPHTVTIDHRFDQAPANAFQYFHGHPYKTYFYDTDILVRTRGNPPSFDQTYEVYDENEAGTLSVLVYSITFHTDGSWTLNVPNNFVITDGDSYRVRAPNLTDSQHTNFGWAHRAFKMQP